MIQRHVWVSGEVQGVGFRASLLGELRRLCGSGPTVKGYVKNLADGRVEAVFQGPDSLVLALVAWCKHGPKHADVSHLEVEDEPLASDLPNFTIARDS